MAGVQYFGQQSVVKAYKQREFGSFAIFQGSKQMVFAYCCDSVDEGEEKLNEFLSGLWNGTTAVYTMKVYDSVEKITPSTQDSGSFNFKLNSETSNNHSASDNLIISKLTAIEERLLIVEGEESDEETEPDQWEKIGALLEKPLVIAGINKLLGIDLTPAKVGNVPTDENEALIVKAVNLLKTKDPQLGLHLWKLAQIAEQKPANFKFLLSTLDSM